MSDQDNDDMQDESTDDAQVAGASSENHENRLSPDTIQAIKRENQNLRERLRAVDAGDPDPRAINVAKDKARQQYAKELDRLKAQVAEYEPLAVKAKELEDANKTEVQRFQEAAEANRSRADKAEAAARRFEVAFTAAPEHATPAQIRAVAKRVTGDTDEELEADAAELFSLLAPKGADPEPPKVPGKPTERMPRGGGDPSEEPEETDPRKLAALIPRRR